MMTVFSCYSSCACADLKTGFCTGIFSLLKDADNQKNSVFHDSCNGCAKVTLDKQKGAWIGWTEDHKSAGMLLCRLREKLKEPPENFSDGTIFGELDPVIFPRDGRFVEIFQLWVEPEYRRVGLATQLKRHVEVEAAQRHIGMIYTHTLESNFHVLELNHKLGYKEVRKGPIWDDAIRVSLVKHIINQGEMK